MADAAASDAQDPNADVLASDEVWRDNELSRRRSRSISDTLGDLFRASKGKRGDEQVNDDLERETP